MELEELIERVNKCNRAKGHRTGTEVPDLDAILSRTTLIHTEVSEAADLINKYGGRARGMSAFRVSTKEGNRKLRKQFALELADVMIRTIDLADLCGIDLEEALAEKLRVNESRAFRYGTSEEG